MIELSSDPWIIEQGKTGVVACLGLRSPTGIGKLARRERRSAHLGPWLQTEEYMIGIYETDHSESWQVLSVWQGG